MKKLYVLVYPENEKVWPQCKEVIDNIVKVLEVDAWPRENLDLRYYKPMNIKGLGLIFGLKASRIVNDNTELERCLLPEVELLIDIPENQSTREATSKLLQNYLSNRSKQEVNWNTISDDIDNKKLPEILLSKGSKEYILLTTKEGKTVQVICNDSSPRLDVDIIITLEELVAIKLTREILNTEVELKG